MTIIMKACACFGISRLIEAFFFFRIHRQLYVDFARHNMTQEISIEGEMRIAYIAAPQRGHATVDWDCDPASGVAQPSMFPHPICTIEPCSTYFPARWRYICR